MNSWKFLICSASSALRPKFLLPPGRLVLLIKVAAAEWNNESWENKLCVILSSLIADVCVCSRDLLYDLEKCNADPVAIAECFVSKVKAVSPLSSAGN